MTAPDTSHGGPRRAIWGLVNDGYALVAKTANLSYDEAFELCRVPDIGDPSAYLDRYIAPYVAGAGRPISVTEGREPN